MNRFGYHLIRFSRATLVAVAVLLLFSSPGMALQKKIVYESKEDGHWEIYTMNTDGTGATRLTHGRADNRAPEWSPDGTKIVFVSERDGNKEIYGMDADGANPVNLTRNGGQDYNPAWSPNGKRVAFVSDRDGNQEIYSMAADGGEVRRLTRNEARDYSPQWSPDGTKIAFASAGPKDLESVWVAEYAGGSINNRRMVSARAPWTALRYFANPSWQPCTAVTKACTVQAFASPGGKPGSQQPAAPKSGVPATKSASTCGGKCGITSATLKCGSPSPADVTGSFTFKAPDNSSVSARWRFSFFKKDGTLLRRFPQTGWYGPQGVAASRSMTKSQLYASTVAKRMLATVQDENDPNNTSWSKWAPDC